MRLGIHHERLPPGRRLCWPHAEADEEEFVFVLEGEPDLWLDGQVRRLKPGDGVSFPAGTGIAHTFPNPVMPGRVHGAPTKISHLGEFAGISAAGRTKSTRLVAMALRGMESYSASAGS